MKIRSKFKLGTAKARRIYLVIALALFPLLASEKASAQNVPATILHDGLPGITLPFGGGDIHVRYQHHDDVLIASASRTFCSRTTGADSSRSPGEILMVHRSKCWYNSCSPRILDPVNNNADLGGSVPNPYQPASTWQLSLFPRYSLSYSASLAPGVYHIFFDNRAIVADSNFADHAVTANQFTVTIVPEPATAALVVMGGVIAVCVCLESASGLGVDHIRRTG